MQNINCGAPHFDIVMQCSNDRYQYQLKVNVLKDIFRSGMKLDLLTLSLGRSRVRI